MLYKINNVKKIFFTFGIGVVANFSIFTIKPAYAVSLSQTDKSLISQINTELFTNIVLVKKFGADFENQNSFQGNFSSSGFSSSLNGAYLGKPLVSNTLGNFNSNNIFQGQSSGVRLNNDTTFGFDFSYDFEGSWEFSGFVKDDFGTDDFAGELRGSLDSDGSFELSGGLNYDGEDIDIESEVNLDPGKESWNADIEGLFDLGNINVELKGTADENGGNVSGSVEKVPEPFTILGSLTAIGIGVALKKKYSKELQKVKV